MSSYQPIACGLHELYQLAVMQRKPLDLVWTDVNGKKHVDRGLPKDVCTRRKGEFLLCNTEHKGMIEIRLDFIHEARWVFNGKLLGGE